MCNASLHSILVVEPWIYDGVTRAFFHLKISLSTMLEIQTNELQGTILALMVTGGLTLKIEHKYFDGQN